MRKTRKLLERRRRDVSAPRGTAGRGRLRARALRPTPSMLVASCALIVALGGVAAAAIPHSATGVITACYGPSGGLKVLDAQAGAVCAQNEQKLTWNHTGSGGGGGAGMHAHVRADGTLDVARSTPGIAVTRVPHGLIHPPFPVYCLTLPAPAVNVVATIEKTTSEFPDGTTSYTADGLNASVDPAVMNAAWACPAGTDAAILNSQRPNGGFYAQFE